MNYSIKHRHEPGYYGIQYNHSGKLDLKIGINEELHTEDSCLFISHPGAIFEYGAPSGQTREHYFLCFKGSRIDEYIKSGLLPLNDEKPLIPVKHPEQFKQAMLNLEKLVHSSLQSKNRTVLMLEELLLQIHEQNEADEIIHNRQSPLFGDLIRAIEKHPEKIWDFNKEAAKLQITTTHFRRLFKQLCGSPPRQFLLNQRLRMAAALLIEGSESIGEIAERVGINDIFYFSKAFKERYSLPPLTYRKESVAPLRK